MPYPPATTLSKNDLLLMAAVKAWSEEKNARGE